MIILNKKENVNLPNYDDLVNKPSINGVVLEGNKTSQELKINFDTTNFYTKREVNERIADSITGIENEFGNYYTKTQSDSKYQPKGNYLTSIPSEYVTESELSGYATEQYVDDAIKDIKIDASVDLTGYATESWVSANYQTKGEYATVDYVDSENEYLQGEIDAKQNILVSGGNIKTINGQTILGSGNIIIDGGSGGSTDLTGYATEDWVSANYQTKGNYLTSIPSEYITETELNDAIAGLGGGSDIPYVVITTQSATSTTLQYTGDLNGVINAVKNQTPYNAYFYNKATYYGVRYALYEVDFVFYDSNGDSGVFYVHSEGGGGQHRVTYLSFTFENINA